MRIAFLNKLIVRRVGDLEWSDKSGRVVSVSDPELVGELLTNGGFSIADDEPLLRVMSVENAGRLALDGRIATIGALANLNGAKAKKTARAMDIPAKIVLSWADTAGRVLLETVKEKAGETAVKNDGDETAVSSPIE